MLRGKSRGLCACLPWQPQKTCECITALKVGGCGLWAVDLFIHSLIRSFIHNYPAPPLCWVLCLGLKA